MLYYEPSKNLATNFLSGVLSKGVHDMKLQALLYSFCLALALCITAPAAAQWVEDGTEICVHASNQQYCQIISDGAGGAIITWDDSRIDGYDDIYAQRIDAYGNVLWDANGIVVCGHTGIQIYPQLVPDGEGGAIICWVDSRDGGYSVYAQRIDADGDTLWNGDGVAMESTVYSCWSNYITTDNAGGAIVVWTDPRSGYDQVYAQRVNAGGDTLWDGGGVRACPTAATQNDPQVATDCSHGCFVTWWDGRGSSWDVYAQRINAAGAISWGSGFPACTYTDRQSSPVITTDYRGGVVIAWEDYRSGSHYDIYAGRIDTAGAYSWSQIICDQPENQQWIDIEPGLNGGAIIAWTDARTDMGDVFAQAVDKNGTVLWTTDGVGVCTYAGYQAQIQIAPDGAGGAVFVFYDYRTGDGDIYCQRIDAGGNLLWDSDGVVICDATGTQSIPMITSDGAGGGIMCWNDQRNLWNDIFAQRVERNGYWGYPAAPIVEITDVPNDQGGKVTVRWNGTRIDEYPNQVVTHYSVWRSITGPEAAMMLGAGVPEFAALEITPDFEGPAFRRTTLGGASYWWEWVANMDAHYLDNYALTSPTLFDSTGAGTGYHYFFLSAHTSDPFSFWDSQPDSGYSVDNLAPCMPAALAGEQSFVPEGLDITWDPNTEIDLGAYAVYRGTSEGFVPGPGTLLHTSCDTFYFDGDWRWDDGFFYKVSAIDIHDNESPFALLRPADITGGETPGVPLAYYLDQNVPNPFNPSTKITFGLREAGYLSLRIYNAAGRLVRVLVNEHRDAGRYEITWDGRDGAGRQAASGVYFYKLNAGSFEKTRKMVLLR